MKKKEVVICFVFVALLVGCASSPQLFVPQQSKLKYDLPSGGQAPIYEMLFYVHEYNGNYTLYKVDVPGEIRSYIIEARNTKPRVIRATRSLLARRRATAEAVGKPLTEKFYTIKEGDFVFVVDGETYSLQIISETKIDVSWDDAYIVTQKIASLKDIYYAILNCSQLSIDGSEISPEGITAIKKFLE